MKQFSLILFLVLFLGTANAQLQFATVERNGERLNNIPRWSWNIPVSFNLVDLNETLYLFGGARIHNAGVIFDEGANRFKMRGIGMGIHLRPVVKIGEKLGLGFNYEFNYFAHFKEKVFIDGERAQKQILHREWWSDRFNPFNHVLGGFIVFPETGFNIYFGYYLNNFMNPDFTEEVNGNELMPYAGLNVQKFDIGISLMLGDFDNEDVDVPLSKNL